MKDHKISR